jgi:predicted esterase
MKNRLILEAPTVVDYHLHLPSNPQRLLLLLHGWGQHGHFMHKRFLPLVDGNTAVLSPNGPFPLVDQMPLDKRDHSEELVKSFGWYLFDPSTGKFFIDYHIPAEILKRTISSLGLAQIPCTVLGYSQGGYLSIFVAEKCPQIDRIIGVNCGWRSDLLVNIPKARVDAYHGADDKTVDPIRAHDSHSHLLKLGMEGTFTAVPGEGHLLTHGLLKAIALNDRV